MIDGLKLTLGGGELRALLEARARHHDDRAAWWTRERIRAAADGGHSELPDHICSHEAERHAWRAGVLRFMRDHVVVGETYQLSAADLDTGELLPPRPAWLEQHESEERIRPARTLDGLATTLDEMVGAAYAATRAHGRTSPPGRPSVPVGNDERC